MKCRELRKGDLYKSFDGGDELCRAEWNKHCICQRLMIHCSICKDTVNRHGIELPRYLKLIIKKEICQATLNAWI